MKRCRLSKKARLCFVSAFAVLVLWSSLAHADPMHLRTPLPEQTMSWQIGAGTLASFGAWNLPAFGTAMYARLDFEGLPSMHFLLGGAFATKFRLAGKDRGFRLDAYAMGGIEWKVLPTRDIGAMASLTLQGVYQGRSAVFALELSGPFSFQFHPTPRVRMPIVGGAWLMFRAGKLWFGIYGSAGINLVVGEAPTRLIHFALVWSLSMPKIFSDLQRRRKS